MNSMEQTAVFAQEMPLEAVPAEIGLPFAIILGLLFGSFLNCMAMRIVRGENWVSGRSRCPSCGHVLGAADLIPVLSFLFLRGKCRYCGKKISPRYPITELLFAVITACIYLRAGVSVLTIRLFVYACCLFALSLTDLEARIIPNGCLLLALVTWAATEPFLFTGWTDFWLHVGAMIGAAVLILLLVLVMDAVLKKDSMGGGDIKLIAVLGLYTGAVGMMFLLFFASILGIFYAAARGRLKHGEAVAFGPFLAASGLFMALWGEIPVEWYLRLAGFVQ